jgi:hypothetical protein
VIVRVLVAAVLAAGSLGSLEDDYGAARSLKDQADVAVARGGTADAGCYDFLSQHLYRFGLERPARAVLADFLGRPVSKDAILADLRRLRP